MQVFLLASCFFGDLQMFSTPHSPLSEEVFVEKELSFFGGFLPVEIHQNDRKAAWFMGCGTLHQRASGFPNCVQHLILGVFFGQLHTLPHSCLFHLPVQRNRRNACVSRVSGAFGLLLRAGSSEKNFFKVIFFVFQTALKFAARTPKLAGSFRFKDFCHFFVLLRVGSSEKTFFSE